MSSADFHAKALVPRVMAFGGGLGEVTRQMTSCGWSPQNGPGALARGRQTRARCLDTARREPAASCTSLCYRNHRLNPALKWWRQSPWEAKTS